MSDFKTLKVWQKAHELALQIYKATGTFPGSELYGLTNQMRRCAVSISSNIAEGCGRNGTNEFIRFMQIAFGSASELQCQIMLAHDLEYLPLTKYDLLENSVSEVKRMLTALLRKLKTVD